MTGIEIFAKFVCEKGYKDFDDEALTYAKSLCLSGLGMTVAGSQLPAGKVLTAYVKELGVPPEASVLGAVFRTSAEYAALANGTSAHATELEDDDLCDGAYTISVFPAAFALGEKFKLSGKKVLEGFILGYDVQSWIGTACGAPERGWIVASAAGSLGSAACAAKMMGLDFDRTAMAIASAVSQGSGLFRTVGSMGHLYEAGLAARNGISAAVMAKHGLTGKLDILEGPRGFCDALTGRGNFDFKAMESKLGKPYRVMEVGIKKYPCCYLLQRIIDGALELGQENNIAVNDIASIEVEANPLFPHLIHFPEPADREESRFSVNHVVAAALVDKQVSAQTFSDESLNDPRIKALRKKVKTIVHSDWESSFMGGTNPITIKMKNGKVYTKVCDKLKGHPPYLLTPEEVMVKYMDCAAPVLGEKRAERAGKMLLALDELDNITELIKILASPKS